MPALLRAVLVSLLVCHHRLQPALCSEEDMDTLWTKWKWDYGVSYGAKDDEEQRKYIWEENLEKIKANNENFHKGTSSFIMAMNRYGDLTQQEYRRLQGAMINSRTMKRGKTVSAQKLRAAAKKKNVAEVDYRTKGYVTRVKDQGYCGSCWAFSTTGAIEGQIYKKTGRLLSLSEQHLMDCSRSYGTYGCSGAWMANAYDYVVKNGLPSEDTYPYTAMDGQPCLYESSRIVARIKDYRFIPAGDEEALANAVATIGPITVALDADHSSFMFYSSGIYEEPKCNPENLNHAVLLVGYGTEGKKEYWIIKNSWGRSWGENGYMRIARNKDNACGIASYSLYPIV
ncbi:cathepsin L1-like [Scleropages formosus]|uniref:Cathepsin L1-like n=1 Tax=Scleropages formosus TaxID=113540 RepID=A0A0P7VJV5_SCLFO|nr:cathepsin L1-like [Scleropages formosus]KPP73931.1 cathepsin L1-like [Scleropages formosus]